jgi:hypothetical protein
LYDHRINDIKEFMSEKYQPITNFYDPNDGQNLYWNLQLPGHIDAERILINTNRLNYMHVIAGIGISLVHGYQGEQDAFNTGIAGTNNDGTAVAAATVSLSKAERNNSSLHDSTPRLYYAYSQALVRHEINKPKLIDNIIEAKSGTDVSDDKAWARGLDQELRLSMRQQGVAHLISTSTISDKAYEAAFLTGFTTYVTTHPAGSWVMFAGVGLARSVVVLGKAKLFQKMTGSTMKDALVKRRYSLSSENTFQPDRAALLCCMTAVRGLSKVRK